MIFNMYGGKDVAEVQSFPVYRENINKMYIPRFYGIQRYGVPDKEKMQLGDTIQLAFPKSLRYYQEQIVDVYMKYVNTTLASSTNKKGNGGILEVPCGRGKTVMALKIISLLQKKTPVSYTHLTLPTILLV